MYETNQYLEVLGLPLNATRQEVEEAYSHLVKLWHPDRFINSNQDIKAKAARRFWEIDDAYNGLLSSFRQDSMESEESPRSHSLKKENLVFVGIDRQGSSIYLDTESASNENEAYQASVHIFPLPDSNLFQKAEIILDNRAHDKLESVVETWKFVPSKPAYTRFNRQLRSKSGKLIDVKFNSDATWWSLEEGTVEEALCKLIIKIVDENKQRVEVLERNKQRKSWQALKAKLEMEAQQKIAESKGVQSQKNSSKTGATSQPTSTPQTSPSVQSETAAHLGPSNSTVILSADDKSHLKGVRGWLLVFCVIFTVVTPLFNLTILALGSRIIGAYLGRFPQLYPYATVDTFLALTWLSFGVVVGARVWQQKVGAIKLAKTYLLVNIPFRLFVLLLPSIFGLPDQFVSESLSGDIKSLGHAIIRTIVWYTYFNKSVRVRNTFPDDFN